MSREQQRPKVMAIIGIAIGFSFYIALLIGPVIADRYGLHGIFAITGVLAILCIPLVIWVVPSAINYAPKGDTLPVLTDVKTLFFDPQLRRLNISTHDDHCVICTNAHIAQCLRLATRTPLAVVFTHTQRIGSRFDRAHGADQKNESGSRYSIMHITVRRGVDWTAFCAWYCVGRHDIWLVIFYRL